MNIDEFITKFYEFRQFLNSATTEYLLKNMLHDGDAALKVIKDKFNELGLNDNVESPVFNKTCPKCGKSFKYTIKDIHRDSVEYPWEAGFFQKIVG